MKLIEQFEKETNTEEPLSNGFLKIIYLQKYIEWIEKKLVKKLTTPVVGITLKDKKKICYTTWKKRSGITTMHKQKYKDSNGKILQANKVTKMYQDYLDFN